MLSGTRVDIISHSRYSNSCKFATLTILPENVAFFKNFNFPIKEDGNFIPVELENASIEIPQGSCHRPAAD